MKEEKAKPSAWQSGAKASAVLLLLYVFGILTGNITRPFNIIDLAVNFLVWWVILSVVIGIWRKISK